MTTHRRRAGAEDAPQPAEDGGNGAASESAGFANIQSFYWPHRAADMGEVKAGYRLLELFTDPWVFSLLLLPLLAVAAYAVMNISHTDVETAWSNLQHEVAQLGSVTIIVLVLVVVWFMRQPRPVYLVDFTVFHPDKELEITRDWFMMATRRCGFFSKESIEFQEKLLGLTHIGDNTTENITQNWYHGNDRSMLISNTLFRLGGAAVLLSNRWADRWSAKYRFLHTVRVHKGANDKAYNSVYQRQDDDGNTGVSLVRARQLMEVVGDALKTNMTVLGPLILPLTEQIRFFATHIGRRYCGMRARWKPYVPDFKKAVDHICIHAAGRAVIDGLEENLKLPPRMTEPSRATLHCYGNTSSSSIWYELSYIERKMSVRPRERVWQLAFGSGFKCNSVVWQALRFIPSTDSVTTR